MERVSEIAARIIVKMALQQEIVFQFQLKARVVFKHFCFSSSFASDS